jgi:sulfotransferase family protein
VTKKSNNSAPVSAAVLDLERQFDIRLARPRVATADSSAMRLAAAQWSAAIWAVAEAAGPRELDEAEVARGLDIAHRPVFVCGAHRSGTTLVRDLLDGHPALAVLPSEGTFLTNFERHLQRLRPESWQRFLGCEWLRRLANPIHQDPYWLLGRSSQDTSPYVTFARALIAWWPLVQQRVPHSVSSWPLVAIALAYAHCTGGLTASSSVRRWVEKTPTNERFLGRLRAEFPQSKFIHVVRHPYAVYASHKQAARDAGERLRNAGRILKDLNLSYRTALEQSRCGRSDEYLLIRYEDLIKSAHITADRLAEFLCIEPHPELMRPTAAGLATPSNSSFVTGAEPGRVDAAVHRKWIDVLSRSERERLTAVVGDAALALAYDLTPVGAWRARLLRAAAPITSRFS